MRHFRLSVRWLAGPFLVLGALVLGPNPAWAQTDVLYVVNNKVGIGTSAPFYDLDVPNGAIRSGAGVFVGANAGTYTLDFAAATGADRNIFRAGATGFSNGLTVRYRNSPQAMLYSFINGFVGIGTTTQTHLLDVGTSGAYCDGGAWVNGSSREYKQGIRELSGEDAAEAFAKLNPVRFEYKALPGEGHVGFIAEDVPDLVATPNRKGLSAMDVVAVLTKVVQDQKTLLEEQQKAIAELKQEVAQLKQQK